MSDPRQALAILAAAELIHSADSVAAAVSRVARAISERLRDSNPLLLCVMNGGVPFAGHLMTQLAFPLDFDYVHVSRYGQETSGGELTWRRQPGVPVQGRTVLLVDDILDEGLTLAAIRERLLQGGAAACYTAVVADKLLTRKKPITADFVALTVPDRFLFGYGMDVRGAWRNLPAIYAMRED
ncbi:MAG TPA: hypoxanthine-guanine phosphoribosyltransferase [Candidatus Accumulibacter phosphatis]|nr:MAG: Hypoxanthine-guanine phosphoribosyltransferase [Candidatus Accumulibacter sp. SK-11]HAY28687.1 hypoxanthine-guanine phosphoribosyltransferase [Accumulibacter sp.]HCN67790.1 hypoxanthine-guanine phosphoribosyltransferase [Accumulibacter sp.]HRL77998.1 hypoxanthine-guanine phosphoribosyltransferase [Candidatus Accumulibacter phosphatis]HRQ96722.1 hypoxanthine-guanine phosphoribosyltransferase [Candidatus Accumulibacter phosphatis]